MYVRRACYVGVSLCLCGCVLLYPVLPAVLFSLFLRVTLCLRLHHMLRCCIRLVCVGNVVVCFALDVVEVCVATYGFAAPMVNSACLPRREQLTCALGIKVHAFLFLHHFGLSFRMFLLFITYPSSCPSFCTADSSHQPYRMDNGSLLFACPPLRVYRWLIFLRFLRVVFFYEVCFC